MSNSKHRQELERVDDTAQQCCIVSSFISKTASCYSAWQTVSRRDLALHCFKYSGLYGFRARSRKETSLLKARKGVPLSTNTPGELKKWNTIECINLENLAHSWTTTLLRKKDIGMSMTKQNKKKREKDNKKRKEKKETEKRKGPIIADVRWASNVRTCLAFAKTVTTGEQQVLSYNGRRDTLPCVVHMLQLTRNRSVQLDK